MKLLNIALLLVAIQSDGKSGAGLTTVDAATPYLRADMDIEDSGVGWEKQKVHVEDKPDDVLTSKECKEFVKEAYKETKKIMKDFENNQEDLIDYLCNPVTLVRAGDLSAEAQEALATETNPCKKAMQQRFADAADTIEEYTLSPEACIAGIGNELEDCEPAGDVTNCTVSLKLTMWTSDKNLKTNINFVGMSAWGIPTYTFKYREGTKNFSGGALDTESTYFGAMAQDLLELAPEAVTKSKVNGYYAVDYSKIDVDFYKIA